jgi:hypothetical protein
MTYRVAQGEMVENVERYDKAIECECHGYAAREASTREEDLAAGGCGRIGCCTAAFVCRVCGTRWIVSLPAPEME